MAEWPNDLQDLAEWYETNHITQDDGSTPPDPDPDLEDNPEEDDPED
jgi:hypothetical protein